MPPNTSSQKEPFVLFTNKYLDEDNRPSKHRTHAASSRPTSIDVEGREPQQQQPTPCSPSCTPERYAAITTGAFEDDMANSKLCGECNVLLASSASWFCALDRLFCSNTCRTRYIDAKDAEDAVVSPLGLNQTSRKSRLNLSEKASLHRTSCVD